MKKLLTVLLVTFLALALAACGAAAPAAPAEPAAPAAPAAPATLKVGIINNPPSESGYRAANVADMERVFSAANGYEPSTFYSLNNDEQLQAAQQFITDGVDIMLISAAATDGWDAVLASAKEAGIKVFLFDRMIDTDESNYEAAVVSDMAKEGETAVNWLKAQNYPEYNVVHIQGAMGSDAHLGRTGALQKEFDDGTMNMVIQQTATWDPAQAKQIMESVINAGTPFNVVYAENAGMALGAQQALDEAGITHGPDGDVCIMGFDYDRFALEAVMNGEWNYDGECSPLQADIIHDMIQNGVTQKKVINEEGYADATNCDQAYVDQYGLG
jgi:simple sugar transport system substrate-binding protein